MTPWEHHAPEVVKATARLSDFDLATDDGPALADHLEDAFGAYRRHWAIHFAMPDSRAFGEPFHEAFARLTGGTKEEAREAAFPLLEGAGNMLTRLVDGLYGLARAARGTSAEAVLTGAEPGGSGAAGGAARRRPVPRGAGRVPGCLWRPFGPGRRRAAGPARAHLAGRTRTWSSR